MRARSRQRVPSSWRRGFDWDSATSDGFLGANVLSYDWARVPSDFVDPLTGQHIAPKTLSKTLLSHSITTSPLASGTVGTFWFGLIAWDGPDGAPPTSFLDLPDVTNGSYDWIHWNPVHAVNASGLPLFFQGPQPGADGGTLEFSSQRKLPPGKGLLWLALWQGPVGTSVGFSFTYRFGLKGDVTAVGLGGG